MSQLKQVLRELLAEEEEKEKLPFEENADVDRMLQQDRTPVNSESPSGKLVTEYGANKAINAHMNR